MVQVYISCIIYYTLGIKGQFFLIYLGRKWMYNIFYFRGKRSIFPDHVRGERVKVKLRATVLGALHAFTVYLKLKIFE